VQVLSGGPPAVLMSRQTSPFIQSTTDVMHNNPPCFLSLPLPLLLLPLPLPLLQCHYSGLSPVIIRVRVRVLFARAEELTARATRTAAARRSTAKPDSIRHHMEDC
jgi:hypothetical protein